MVVVVVVAAVSAAVVAVVLVVVESGNAARGPVVGAEARLRSVGSSHAGNLLDTVGRAQKAVSHAARTDGVRAAVAQVAVGVRPGHRAVAAAAAVAVAARGRHRAHGDSGARATSAAGTRYRRVTGAGCEVRLDVATAVAAAAQAMKKPVA